VDEGQARRPATVSRSTHLPSPPVPSPPLDVSQQQPRMNWTGGSLQRSKKANKGTLQKQRAHFARARARLQDGPDRHRASNSLSPLHPGFFRDVDTEGPRSTLRSFSSRSVRHAGRSKTLKGRSSRATASPVASDRISPSQAAGRRRLHGPDRDDTTIRDMGGEFVTPVFTDQRKCSLLTPAVHRHIRSEAESR